MVKLAILGNQSSAMVNFWTVFLKTARKYGYEAICLTPPGDGESEEKLKNLGCKIINYPLDRKGLNPLRDACTLVSLYKIFKRERPEILFSYTIKPVIYGGLAARLAGVENRFAAITGLGYAFEADNLLKKAINSLAVFLYSEALRGAEAVFFQNEEDREVFSSNGIIGKNTKIIRTKGTGVDTIRFTPVPPVVDPPVFLLVGRLLEAKGLYEYAEAARLLKARRPYARFQILGPPEQGLGSVPTHVLEKWQNEGIIEYLGQTRDVRPFVAAASVMVLPSWREGAPCSIMEGMSMGRAAVATDAPGCREVVKPGVNGFLTPLKDPEALAEAMEKFILNRDLIISMGRAGRIMAENEFDAALVAEKMLQAMAFANATK